MKQKLKILLLLAVFLLLGGLAAAGCQKAQAESEYKIYYLNKDLTKIIGKEYVPTAKTSDTQAMITEFLTVLAKDSGDVDYKKPIPGNVSVNNYSFDGSMLTVNFGANYNSMDDTTEVLSRAAIVRTMTEITGVKCLTFYVGDSPLTDSSGNVIGVMTNDTFVENPGKQINSIQNASLVLFFADKDGKGLIKEKQEVHYSTNVSMEKLVMEHLLEGPESSNAQPAIPVGTKLLNVSVLDGVCYVNLDETFINNQNYSIDEKVVMYSIVDSLTEVPGISKVQISVNGNSNSIYRDRFELSEIYTKNEDMVTGNGELDSSSETITDTETN